MTNSTKATRYSTIFLAAILVAGTITAFLPSFMVGTAQAAPYPDMDREKKEDKKSVSVSSLKCNNINVNVNGLTLDVFPPFLGGGDLAAEAVDDNTGASSFTAGNNGDGSQIKDFRFICINNNNNTVIEEQQPVEECAETEDIEACFDEFLLSEDFGSLRDILASSAGLTVEIAGQEVTLRSFNDICLAFKDLTFEQLEDAIENILDAIGAGPVLVEFFSCIAEALDIPIPPPPPIEICDDGIDNDDDDLVDDADPDCDE